MYERFFHLRERPFALSPDPDYLYPSRAHREALSYLRYGIESQAGFVLITGEIGSGKTTLLQALLRGLDGQTTVIRLMNTLLDPTELLQAMAIDLGFDPDGLSKPALLRELANRLVEAREAGRLVLLVIDEAQNLGFATLEEIRMLSNLETEKSKLVQIILVGQPDLRDKLAAGELEQLRQRITVSYHLAALDQDETEAYINHRLRRASLGAPLVFPREVTSRIHARARGVPRLVNVICDAMLVFGYAEERRVIDLTLVEEALLELEATGVLRPSVPSVEDGAAPVSPEPRRESSSQAEPSYAGERAVQAPARPWSEPETAPAVPRAEEFQAVAAETGPASDLVEREATLRAREAQVERRESQLADQRRVLEEEYRLFHAPQPQGLASAGVGRQAVAAAAPTWPPLSARPRRPAPVPAPRPARREPVEASAFTSSAWREAPPRRRFWRRVKHVLLGVTEPVVEDRS